jgi:hypothetical protein
LSEPRINLPWSEQFRIVAKQWCDADAAASILEDSKSAFLSARIQELIEKDPKIALNKAEASVKASDHWREWIEGMVEARKKANLLKVQMEYLRMKFNEWQSDNANRRAEMRL